MEAPPLPSKHHRSIDKLASGADLLQAGLSHPLRHTVGCFLTELDAHGRKVASSNADGEGQQCRAPLEGCKRHTD